MADKIINFKLSPKQLLAWKHLHDKKTTEIFYGGAAGGGKTLLGSRWLIEAPLRYPGTRYLMGRARLKALKQSTLLTFFQECRNAGLQAKKHYNYNSTMGEIKFFNGSEIHLKDLFLYPTDPDFASLGSTEYTGAFLDEVAEISAKAKDIVMSRMRYKLDQYNLVPKLLMASNPAKNFAYYDYYRPWKEKKLKKFRAFIMSHVWDNPYISQHYVENLKKMENRSARERLLFGNWEYEDDPAKLFEYDWIVDLFTNAGVHDPNDRYLTCDVARFGDDKTVVFYWEGWVVMGCWAFPKSSVEFTKKFLLKKAHELNVRRSNIVIDEDGVGGGVVDGIPGCYGFMNAGKAITRGEDYRTAGKEKKTAKYANLKAQCYFELRPFMRAGNIGIRNMNSEDKETFIQDMEQIRQKDPAIDDKPIRLVSKEELREMYSVPRSPDYADAFMLRVVKAIDKTGQMTPLADPENLLGLA